MYEQIYYCTYKNASYTMWNNLINPVLTLWFGKAMKLLVDLPLVEQMTKGHHPDLLFGALEEGHTVKNQSGK